MTLYYKINGAASWTTYTGPFAVSANDVITAYASKAGRYVNSPEATYIYIPNQPGVFADVVYLDDRENHSYSYYSKTDCPIHRLHPADVKITYYGNGTRNMTKSNSSETGDAPTSFSADATGVKVGIASDETQSTFVYYKTLEKENEDGTGNYPYTLIPNPFQVRPTFGNDNNRWRGFYAWRVKSLSSGLSITDGTNHYGVNSIIPAETDIEFVTTKEYGNEVEFEALWAQAYLVKTNDPNGLNSNLPYERNFMVLTSDDNVDPDQTSYSYYYGTTTYAYTVSSVYPNGTSDGTTPTTAIGRTTLRGSLSNNRIYLISLDDALKIEYITLNGGNLFADGHDLVIGRGVECRTAVGYVVGAGYLGGRANESLTERDDVNNEIRIESGTYNNFTGLGNIYWSNGGYGQSAGWSSIGITFSNLVSQKYVFGSDYDRAKGEQGNDALTIVTNSGGSIYGGQKVVLSDSDNKDRLVFDWYVKSGKMHDGIIGSAAGGDESIYLGGTQARYNNGYYEPLQYIGKRRITLEGGNVASIAGGMNSSTEDGNYENNYTNQTAKDNVVVRMKGGTVRGAIYGAAEFAGAVGGRTYVITGGTVNGWIAGGCNGVKNSGGELYGFTYIYVGGNAKVEHTQADPTIGDSNTQGTSGAKGGYIFGAGCGIKPKNYNENYPSYYLDDATVGRVFGSTIVVSDNASVSRDVYGGGNFGFVDRFGQNQTEASSNIYILDDATVQGNVFGGSNNQQGQVVNIYMKSGSVKQNVYGGSNVWGNIHGKSTVNISGGTVGTELAEGQDDNNTGRVFGGGCGVKTVMEKDTEVNVSEAAEVLCSVYGGGERGNVNGLATVNVSGGIIGHVGETSRYGGNVYGGGKGLAGSSHANETNVASTTVNISGGHLYGSAFGGGENGHILGNTAVTVSGGQIGDPKTECHNRYHGNVYGGGRGIDDASSRGMNDYSPTAGQVRGNSSVTITGGRAYRNVYGGGNIASVVGKATVSISGGIVGEDGIDETVVESGNTIYLGNGYVFGSGHGRAGAAFANLTYVKNTEVNVSEDADIRGSVFGGGEDGHVNEDTKVTVTGGIIGAPLTTEENTGSADGTGPVIFRGNVYGGGRGIDLNGGTLSATAGKVYGNTEVEISGGHVIHNVYGGGSLANVGEADKDNTGRAKVTIKGNALIGTPVPSGTPNGGNSGRVFGSGRGLAANTEHSEYADFAYVKNTIVEVSGNAQVLSSVFGGGEDGHVRKKTIVNIKGGTIGRANNTAVYVGNVYGGGRGVDHNGTMGANISRTAGKVNVETEVNVSGGRIYRNVYGGGSMASVGEVMQDANGNTLYYYYNANGNEVSTINPDAEGVPTDSYMKLRTGTGYENNGNTHVVISGGEIGVDGDENGHVFGSARGLAGSIYRHLSYTGQTDVLVEDKANIHGSVFGGGEDGHVLTDTHVKVQGGVVGTKGDTGYEGNVYGGGRGLDRDANQHYSPTAGKTYGNTLVDVIGGTVKGSVFGGGRLSSVGIAENEQTGKATVNIGGGSGTAIVGTINDAQTSVIYGGNVYGGGKGFAGAEYKYMTYVKNTIVNIKTGADIHGSVFGGGEDGHVRENAKVNVTGGEIGDPESQCTNRYHGNVYGGGRGIDRITDNIGSKDDDEEFSWTAGRVNWSAEVNISGGHVYRNVYGGGNIASVGQILLDDNDQPVLRPNGISQLAPKDIVPIDKFLQPRYNFDGTTWTLNNDFGKDPQNHVYSDDNLTGWAKVNITGGIIGSSEDQDHEHGNVFGSSHGKAGSDYQYLSYVINTNVMVDYKNGPDANNIIKGSVFGGGEDGHVNMNTKVTVNKGQIGNLEGDELKGNVYGGGRGIDEDANHQMSPSAGLVKGHTRVYINGGTILHNVYAGSNASAVWEEKVVNINGGEIKGSVFGGSKAVPLNRLCRGLKTVNMRGGHVYGNVYGCSQLSRDGVDTDHPSFRELCWTAFVNISGGEIGTAGNSETGNVHGAGFSSTVNGSTAVNIGKNAIMKAKNKVANVYYNDRDQAGEPAGIADLFGTDNNPVATQKLIIRGSVYGGSDYYGSEGAVDWTHTDLTGVTNIVIDGEEYNTKDGESATNYMAILGGLFGSSTHCESGALGRNILLRNYGMRNPDGNAEMTEATRTLTSIQRCNNLIIDNANVNLSGIGDITGASNRNFAVLKVDDTLYMANASAFNLGSLTAPAYMDSIHMVRSVHRMPNSGSVYDNYLFHANRKVNGTEPWEWIGVNPNGENTQENACLFYTKSASSTPLTFAQENVILFNGDSRLWVRYHRGNRQLYGELQGFFRMKSRFEPYGMESFAYARPKITDKNNNLANSPFQQQNESDGGFLSYETQKNFFTQKGEICGWNYPADGDDGGADFTKTKQYPYFNILEVSKGDIQEYREWVIPKFEGKYWYVDGRGIGNGGWGQDKAHNEGWGHYPDKPKLTVSGAKGTGDTQKGGICVDDVQGNGFYNFDFAKDIIFVVGPMSASLEADVLNLNAENYTLKLFRYPGGHELRNGKHDVTVSTQPAVAPTNTSYNGLDTGVEAGPGANVGALLDVNDDITLNNVLLDGLYGYLSQETEYYQIPTTFNAELDRVKEPLAVTHADKALTLMGSVPTLETGMSQFGTIIRRGYNGTDAEEWYTNADYSGTTHHGGAIYVDPAATLNVKSLVTVEDNKQLLQIGGSSQAIECNVYLPTFAKHINITGALTFGTQIGVTSPIRNTSTHFVHNTFSPVAVATTQENAAFAWEKNMFLDDQQWFFVNGHTNVNHKDTYYSTSIEDYAYPYTNSDAVVSHFDPETTLFFGWTWANVVRKAPEGFAYNDINSAEDLAWLTSLVNGFNMQEAGTLSSTEMKQTADLDMQAYVWVPIGAMKSGAAQFGGSFDGQGHLINHLDIAYLGDGDRRYERLNYGLFGSVNNGTVNRTFVTSGYMKPVGIANIGGLVGSMDGTNAVVSNSEASVDIHCPDNSSSAAGGLVGTMHAGEIHSSMAIPVLNANQFGTLGGMVGRTEQNEMAKNINNAYVNAKFVVGANSSVTAGGLVGVNYGNAQNCYVHLADYTGLGASFGLLVGQSNGGSVTKCYASNQTYTNSSSEQAPFPLSHYVASGDDIYVTDCHRYSDVMDADNLGYMYFDNVVTINNKDVPMFRLLNKWAASLGNKYAQWSRPAIAEINNDLPVLLLSNTDKDGKQGGGDFRDLATYNGGKPQTGAFPTSVNGCPYVVLQYGGAVRDNAELNPMLERLTNADNLYIYGDVTEKLTESVKVNKVSVHEDAAIQHPGTLAKHTKTYVGVTFDNSYSKAYSTPGINWELYGEGPFLLPHDWHMFSSPLSNAPLGFDYHDQNQPVEGQTNFNEVNNNKAGHFNNIWHNRDMEFNWLNGGNKGDIRYWMKGWENSLSQKDGEAAVDGSTWQDGYFPSKVGGAFEFGQSLIKGSDEENRYPYGMDLYTWTEPDYHWINFKRNGPNHWHSDVNETTEHHDHIDYKPYDGATANVNEEILIVGRGYMASISDTTFMQSHGSLNADAKSIVLTREGKNLKGWNLVGNPYHAYLNFDELAKANPSVLGQNNGNYFYVVYDADRYEDNAYVYYPMTGSNGGAYAGQYLHPHQGFYVLAKTKGDLNFNEDMTATRANLGTDTDFDGHFRDEWHPNYPLVNLYLSSDKGCADVTVIEFERPEWGGAKKLKELRVGDGLFYAQHDDTHYAALFAKAGTERVPLWFEAKDDDVFTIKWNTANGDFQQMYLIDNMTGVRYDMIANDSYTFEGHKGDYPSRFYITFSVTDVEENGEETDHGFAFFDGSQWVVTGEGRLEFIDLQGRVLMQTQVSGQGRVDLPQVAPSIYLLRLTNGQETRIQKDIVNR